MPESLSLVLTKVRCQFLASTSQEPVLTLRKSLTAISAKMSFLQSLITSGLIDNSIHGKNLRVCVTQELVRQTALSG